MHPPTPKRPLLDPLRVRLTILTPIMVAAIISIISSLTPPPENWFVSHCKWIVGEFLVDDASSIRTWMIYENAWISQDHFVNLRFRHLDRNGSYRVKEVSCSFEGDTLDYLWVDGRDVPLEEGGEPSSEYLHGPEYRHLR